MSAGRQKGVIGHLEVARGWVYKLQTSPQRWEWRLLILQDTGTLAYFCEGGDGTLETRGLVRSGPSLASHVMHTAFPFHRPYWKSIPCRGWVAVAEPELRRLACASPVQMDVSTIELIHDYDQVRVFVLSSSSTNPHPKPLPAVVDD